MDNELLDLIKRQDQDGIERYLALRDERTFDRGYHVGGLSSLNGSWYEEHNPFRKQRLAEEAN